MTFLVISLVAGVLTVLAPCILPLLPVVVGSSASGRSRLTPYVVVGSLAISIIAFTYLLKASTVFIMVPPEIWTYISGGILVLFGIVLVFPTLWERLPGLAKISLTSNKLVGTGYQRKSLWGDVLIGTALGPIFSTCSPTYFVILASVLPASFLLGTVYLLAYVFGLSVVLLLIALLGQRFSDRLNAFSDSRGWFKKCIGILFITLGLLIITGLEKRVETAILDSGFFDITKFENKLLERTNTESVGSDRTPYVEIVNPSGFLNTREITLGELVGEKVILLDFMTYSCINCQRTFPYVNAWYEKYREQGLEIVGIHTPEFAFEHDIDNVREALEDFGIRYPVVLDNDYSTWRAYGNRFWPRKYLIDINGNIVYDHIGEGAYAEIEMKIRELLVERARVMNEGGKNLGLLVSGSVGEERTSARSPETYFGSARGSSIDSIPFRILEIMPDQLYLGGSWHIEPEFALSLRDSKVAYRYSAKRVYVVASSRVGGEIEIFQDGAYVGSVDVNASKLYTLITNDSAEEHLLKLHVAPGIEIYTFTFG